MTEGSSFLQRCKGTQSLQARIGRRYKHAAEVCEASADICRIIPSCSIRLDLVLLLVLYAMGLDNQSWVLCLQRAGLQPCCLHPVPLQLLHASFLGAVIAAMCPQPTVPKTRSSSTC